MLITTIKRAMSNPIPSESGKSMLRVTFAPDFRALGPYQQLLADALAMEKIQVGHLQGYRRVLPLYRGLRGVPMDILHLHYPVHYFLQYNKWDTLRKMRFPFDLGLATRNVPLVYTVHDLYPMDHPEDFLIRAGTRYLLQQASAIIVHSAGAAGRISEIAPSLGEKCTVIPHGDLSPTYGEPLPQAESRARLGLGEGKICLAFGIITANKGAEELIEFWKRERPGAILAVVGKSKSPAYGRRLQALAAGVPNICLKLGFQSDEQLRLWFSATDCVVINYRKIFTSGVASLARSYGLPVLIPARHATVDLDEPHPSVYRFDDVSTNFGEMLQKALLYRPGYANGLEWRRSIAWDVIAAKTRRVYDSVKS
jgi:hypothetical protein